MKNDPNLSGTIHIGIETVKNRMFMVPMDTGFSNTEYRSFTKEGIDYYYLLSYLKYKEKELVSAYVKTGTTVESIIMNLFLKLEVPFPSYEEQIRISNVIRCNDKKLQALAEEVECWKEKKKALMQVLLTGTVRVKT